MKQPEALRLAFALESHDPVAAERKAAAELRRQHALIAELAGALEMLFERANRNSIDPFALQRAAAALSKAKES